jgi:hypothetical protein
VSQPPPAVGGIPMAAVPLISFRPPPDVQRAINARGALWHVHRIEHGHGAVNIDNYRVKILALPYLRGINSLRGLLKHIRLNINDFVDPDSARFAPYTEADGSKWRSDYPVGAVIHIDLGQDWGAFNPEDGAVVCSSYDDTHWIFSTLHTTGDMAHPVAGNRQFGFYVNSGPSVSGSPADGAYVYVRAADRISASPFNAEMSDIIFNGGHRTWVSFQHRLAHFINARGGKAAIVPPYSARHDWAQMREHHKPTVDWVQRGGPGHGKGEADVLSTHGGPM